MLMFGVVLYSQHTPESNIQWVKGAAAMQSADANRPMLLYFAADWCPPCKAMKKDVWPDDRVEQAVNNLVVPVYLDVDDPNNKPLVEQHRVKAIPTFVLLRKGRQVARMTGYLSADQVIGLAEAAR